MASLINGIIVIYVAVNLFVFIPFSGPQPLGSDPTSKFTTFLDYHFLQKLNLI